MRENHHRRQGKSRETRTGNKTAPSHATEVDVKERSRRRPSILLAVAAVAGPASAAANGLQSHLNGGALALLRRLGLPELQRIMLQVAGFPLLLQKPRATQTGGGALARGSRN